jgi:hypothetical protein
MINGASRGTQSELSQATFSAVGLLANAQPHLVSLR